MERNKKTNLPVIQNHSSYLRYKKEYYQRNKSKWPLYDEKEKIKKHLYHQGRKLKAMQIISGREQPECISCHCTVPDALEINHKKILTKEARGKRACWFYRQIINGKRETNDLEIRCRVCNSAHYLLERFGLKFQIEFLGA